MNDLISRQAALDAIKALWDDAPTAQHVSAMFDCEDAIQALPPAQPEQHEIGYSECADAMLKMWIDNVLTDGEYGRIMDKLNAHWTERRSGADMKGANK